MRTAHEFDQAYLNLHVPKEELFWTTYMGTAQTPGELEAADLKLKEFAGSLSHLEQAREALRLAADEKERIALQGWVRFFESNTIESEDARRILSELIDLETQMMKARASLTFNYRDTAGSSHSASSNRLSVNVTTDPDPEVRRTSYEAQLSLEQWVLENGFIEQVKKRNALARAQGFTDYYAYKLMKNEGLTLAELDEIFVPFEKASRDRMFEFFERIGQQKGAEALGASQLMYSLTGEISAELDPYFPFSKSIARWGLSFYRLGIRFRGATLTLDLLDRNGKYENGFMHGPVPSFMDGENWNPARINFTSNAIPTQVGSGQKGIVTLFHEGGHAAHFANVTQNSPCFSQEFPPTSMAYAETQSMFCDSLLSDADWMKRYAKDRLGREIPDSLIRKRIEMTQPIRAYKARSILVVSLFERRLYALDDRELTAENITRLARQVEKEIFGLDSVARPMLIIPHIISESGAGSYQGYLLADMAVYQTREYFKKKYGGLMDEPRIGRDLSEAYWSVGNRITHNQTVKRLTGETISGSALAVVCNYTVDEAWQEAEKQMNRMTTLPEVGSLDDVDLDAKIRVVHGNEVLAESKTSFAQMARDFEIEIERRYPPTATP
ncbi:MAG: peptidase M3 [Proteobacteria bacterium]|nr:MAG: peptidase M3 [Pseudomonadota bacterium]